ncbi:MAG: hypothetical protein BWY09_01207 [Candidatus Hydrogenedentes bacterium ADurb.Bin179]|nr:MAG: hypothetical protein BWY09_01207 [Candidatus Hydrogenedentes bacterium ADurb.Bin179]
MSSGSPAASLDSRIAFKNSWAPDLAIVPINSLRSSRLMPIPLSETVRMRSLRSTVIWTACSSAEDNSGCFTDSKRRLSKASELFEISSRRKMSLLE